MKLKRILLIGLVIVLGSLGYYLYGGSSVPAGQPELVRLNPANFEEFRQEFNASQDRVRMIAMLAPT